MLSDLKNLLLESRDLLQAICFVITIISLPLGFIALWREKRKERRQREEQAELRREEVFQQLGSGYIEYLTLCLQHPELDCFDTGCNLELAGSPREAQRLTLMSILVSLMESSFVLYRTHREKRASQWQGWLDYMETWAQRPQFRKAWPMLRQQFDGDFVAQMDVFIEKHRPATSPTSAEPAAALAVS